MTIYQFIIATQQYTKHKQADAVGGGFENTVTELKDTDGNPTAHLLGLFHRTILLLENGIKPIWVFDGKPPELKKGELKKRHSW